FAVQREAAGVRSRGRCVARRRAARGRACTLLLTVGTFARPGRSGTDRFVFSGRVAVRGATPRGTPARTRALPAGRYRLRAIALTAAGRSSAPVARAFRVRG